MLQEAPRPPARVVPTAALSHVTIVGQDKHVSALRVSIGDCLPAHLDGHHIAVALFRSTGSVALTTRGTLDHSNMVLEPDGTISSLLAVGEDLDTHDVTTWWAVVTSPTSRRSVGATGEIVP